MANPARQGSPGPLPQNIDLGQRLDNLKRRPERVNACKTCRFFRKPSAPPGIDLRQLSELTGNCHLRPPVPTVIPMPVPDGRGGMQMVPQVVSMWPPAHPEEGCGEHRGA